MTSYRRYVPCWWPPSLTPMQNPGPNRGRAGTQDVRKRLLPGWGGWCLTDKKMTDFGVLRERGNMKKQATLPKARSMGTIEGSDLLLLSKNIKSKHFPQLSRETNQGAETEV